MKQRYRKFKRGWGVWYVYDNTNGNSQSLNTRSKPEAERLVHSMNEAERQPILNRQIARAYLMATDPQAITRTWGFVMAEKLKISQGKTQHRWVSAIKDKAFDLIRNMNIVETRSEHFMAVLEAGTVSTNVYLRKIHNFALDMNWLMGPVLVKRQWPKIQFGEKRAITWSEHLRIVEREHNPERRAYYWVCWHVGGAQTDMARLEAKDIDFEQKVLTYFRSKTGEQAQMSIGPQLESILLKLPKSGPLFPYLITAREADRATEFKQRCNGLAIKGVTLHSYRYAWAQRAKALGYPERWAQQALGHSSKAVHRAYAKNVGIRLPSLETYEAPKDKVIQFAQCEGQAPAQPVTASATV